MLMREQLRKISVLLPLFVHPLIRQTFKAILVWPSWRFWQTLQSANSPWGLPLWRMWPLTRLSLGLGLGLGGLNQGSQLAESIVGHRRL